MDAQRVWYVAYGSNLAWARFRCYVAGGQPLGGNRVYAGCRDPSDPARTESLDIPGGLVFAGWSGVWGGGMAFYDARASGRAACRAYLMTTEQFGDIAAQEMRRPPGGEFARDLAGLLPDVESVHTMGPGRYETVTRLGMRDGAPLFTVTHEDVTQLELAAPTSPYLRWIAAGLRESHGWSVDRIGSYLARSPGAVGSWTADEIADLA
jgi:hypothetical protein